MLTFFRYNLYACSILIFASEGAYYLVLIRTPWNKCTMDFLKMLRKAPNEKHQMKQRPLETMRLSNIILLTKVNRTSYFHTENLQREICRSSSKMR